MDKLGDTLNQDDKRKNYNKLMNQAKGKRSSGRPTPQHKLDMIKTLSLKGESSNYICRTVWVTNSTVNKVRQGML